MRLIFAILAALIVQGAEAVPLSHVIHNERQAADDLIRSLGPTFWVRAGNIDSYTIDSSRRVSQMDSIVGSISFTQGTAGNRPTLQSYQGRLAFYFDRGSQQYVSSTATITDVVSTTAGTVILANKINTPVGQEYLLNDTNNRLVFRYENATTAMFAYGYDGAYTGLSRTQGTNPSVLAYRHDGTTAYLSIDLGEVTSGALGTLTNTTGTLDIGCYTTPTNCFDGLVFEVITFNVDIGDTQMRRIVRMLSDFYGVDI